MTIIKKSRIDKFIKKRKEDNPAPILLSIVVIVAVVFFIGSYYNNNSSSIIQRQLSGNSNVEKAWNFYKNEGFSDEATAGVLGNFMRESRIEPNIEERGARVGYGLAQWSYTRRSDLERWTKENKFEVSSLEGQLNFSIFEMEKMKFEKYSYEQFKKINDVREATEVFERSFERAGVVAMEERVIFAQEIYNLYAKK